MTKERKIALAVVGIIFLTSVVIYPAFFFFPDQKINPDTVETVELSTPWKRYTVVVTNPEDMKIILDEIEKVSVKGTAVGIAKGGTNYQLFRFYLRDGTTVNFEYSIDHGKTEKGWKMTTMKPYSGIRFIGYLPDVFDEMFKKYDAEENRNFYI